ncbi:MAG: gliding motility lipoprotein GldD [Candidatus Aphodosoma sp.]
MTKVKTRHNIQHILLSAMVSASLFLIGCHEKYQPKPYAYFRIDLPEHRYVPADTLGPYITEVNEMCRANATREVWMTEHDQWMNVSYPTLNAIVHLSYKSIHPEEFRTVSEESRSLAYKHTIRADAITENYYANDTLKVYGIFYEMQGNAASQAQFFLTDSVHNFLRGSLYFYNTPNADSIAPVAQYIQTDMIHMVETMKWKNSPK